MRNYVFVACFTVFPLLALPASAQVPAAGDLNLQGRVLLKVAVGMVDPAAVFRPVSGMTFVVVGAKGERSEMRSDDAGIATAWLFSGTYRVVSADTVAWEGRPYSWDIIVQVLPGMSTLRLTQGNSASAAALPVPAVVAEAKPPTPSPVAPPPPAPPPAAPPPAAPPPAAPPPAAPPPAAPPPAAPPPAAPPPAAPPPAAPPPAAPPPAAPPPAAPPPVAPPPAAPPPAAPPPAAPPPAAPPPAAPQPVAPPPAAPPPATPQTSPTTRPPGQRIRQGFWANAGFGYGRLGCYLCNGYFNGLAAGLSFGGTLSPRVLLGLGTSGWTKSDNGVTRTLGTLDGRLRFYPKPNGSLFLTGGFGVGFIGPDVSGFGSESQTGFAVVVGIGKDFRVGTHLSLTPFGNAFAIRTANSDASVGQLGLGLTFH